MADTQAEQRPSAGEGRRPVILVAARFEEGRAHKTEVLAPNECGGASSLTRSLRRAAFRCRCRSPMTRT